MVLLSITLSLLSVDIESIFSAFTADMQSRESKIIDNKITDFYYYLFVFRADSTRSNNYIVVAAVRIPSGAFLYIRKELS